MSSLAVKSTRSTPTNYHSPKKEKKNKHSKPTLYPQIHTKQLTQCKQKYSHQARLNDHLCHLLHSQMLITKDQHHHRQTDSSWVLSQPPAACLASGFSFSESIYLACPSWENLHKVNRFPLEPFASTKSCKKNSPAKLHTYKESLFVWFVPTLCRYDLSLASNTLTKNTVHLVSYTEVREKFELHPKVTARDKAWDHRGKHHFLITAREQIFYVGRDSEHILRTSTQTERSRSRKRCAHTQENQGFGSKTETNLTMVIKTLCERLVTAALT